MLLIIPLANALTINEIMYNPSTSQGSDRNLEWIEIYNEDNLTINLSNYKLDGEELNGNIFPYNYTIIARNKTAFKEFYNLSNTTIIQSDISLTNSGDNINLTSENESIFISYKNTYANGNGRTLEWWNGWKESKIINGTPGKKNSVIIPPQYKKLKINEFLPNPNGDDNNYMPFGEWIEIHNPSDVEIDLDGFVVYDNYDSNELYITDTNTYSTIIKPNNYVVVYDNRDSDFSLNNYNYERIRLTTSYPFNESDLIDEVSYASSIERMSWSKNNNDQWVLTEPTPNELNNQNTKCDWEILIEDVEIKESNAYFKLRVNRLIGDRNKITVRGEIKDIFGKTIKTYKSFTDKEIVNTASKKYHPKLKDGIYVLNFYIEDLECDENTENNNFSYPIMINTGKLNINESIVENNTENINENKTKKPKIKEVIKEKIVYVNKTINKTKKLNDFGEIVYESSSFKAKKLIPLFIIITMTFFIVVLIVFKM